MFNTEAGEWPPGVAPTGLSEDLFKHADVSTQTERLERLVAAETGDCCDGDVADRLETLRSLRAAAPDGEAAGRTALKTLGDETRHEIARLLTAADRALCVCEIDPLVDVSDSAISHALSDLHDAGLVTRRKEGTWRYYEATARTEAVLAALDDTREEPR